jgi:hypothetical protein
VKPASSLVCLLCGSSASGSGALRLGNLKPRQWRYLTRQAIDELQAKEANKKTNHR